MKDYIALLKEGAEPPLFSHIYVISLHKDPHSLWQLVYFPGCDAKEDFRNIEHTSIKGKTLEECLDQFLVLAKQCPACIDKDSSSSCGNRLSKTFLGTVSSPRITMKKYYSHKNLCYINNYMGKVGDKIQVSWLMYRILLLLGFRTSVEDVKGGSAGTHMGWYKFILTMCHL